MLRLARHRFALILAALLLGGLGTLSVLTYLRARTLINRQVTTRTLPLSADAVVSSIEHDLLQPVVASTLMADNSLVESRLQRGENDSAVLQNYLHRIQQRTGAATAFLISDKTRRYYHSSGVLKPLDPTAPSDHWYQRFLDSGKLLN